MNANTWKCTFQWAQSSSTYLLLGLRFQDLRVHHMFCISAFESVAILAFRQGLINQKHHKSTENTANCKPVWHYASPMTRFFPQTHTLIQLHPKPSSLAHLFPQKRKVAHILELGCWCHQMLLPRVLGAEGYRCSKRGLDCSCCVGSMLA